MSVFDETKEILENLFAINGDVWVKRKNVSSENIETCNGVAVDDERTHACFLCVALNDTIFKNNNKPEYYHPHCKCKNIKTQLKDVVLDFPIEKISIYLFVNENKHKMMRSMGYDSDDAGYVYDFISQRVRQHFLENKYKLQLLNKNGQHFSINIKIDGKRNRKFNKYLCHIGCVAWPNGKIKIATPLILDKEII